MKDAFVDEFKRQVRFAVAKTRKFDFIFDRDDRESIAWLRLLTVKHRFSEIMHPDQRGSFAFRHALGGIMDEVEKSNTLRRGRGYANISDEIHDADHINAYRIYEGCLEQDVLNVIKRQTNMTQEYARKAIQGESDEEIMADMKISKESVYQMRSVFRKALKAAILSIAFILTPTDSFACWPKNSGGKGTPATHVTGLGWEFIVWSCDAEVRYAARQGPTSLWTIDQASDMRWLYQKMLDTDYYKISYTEIPVQVRKFAMELK